MDHEKRKIVLEAIGLVAIVASLIFVAWELHEVNVASRIAARDSITAGHLEFMGAVIDEEVLPTAIWKMYSNQEDDLSDFEHFQIDIHHQRRLALHLSGRRSHVANKHHYHQQCCKQDT